jgi:hypothetical protein
MPLEAQMPMFISEFAPALIRYKMVVSKILRTPTQAT